MRKRRSCSRFDAEAAVLLACYHGRRMNSLQKKAMMMKSPKALNTSTLAASVLLSLLALTAQPAVAASSTASSVSEGASSAASSGSKSSQSSSASSGNEKTASAGDYRIIDVAAVPDQSGMVRLRLQAAGAADSAELAFLVLPQRTFEKSGLSAGQMVTAREHVYGLEFADLKTNRAFYLVLTDEWYRELNSQSLVL